MQLALGKVILRFFISFFILAGGFDQVNAQRSTFSPEEVQEDMAMLYKKLLKYHPAPFTYQDSSTHALRYLQAYNSIDAPLNIQEAFDLMLPTISDVKDLHTSIGMPKGWAKKQKKQLPILLFEKDEKYFVSYNWSNDSTLIRGTEVLEIADRPISEIAQKVSNYYATDNGNEVAKKYYTERRLSTILNRVMPITDSMKVVFKNTEKDSVFTKYVKTEDPKDFVKIFSRRYPDKIRKNFDYEILDSLNKVAVLDITTFSEKGKLSNINQRKFKKKLKFKMKQIVSDSIQTLVLDMRGNGGGAIVNIPRLISYFAKDKFRTLDSMAVKKKAFLKVFPIYTVFTPIVGRFFFNKRNGEFLVDYGSKKAKNKPAKKYHFDGKLYIIGDGGSYSATVFATSLMLDQGLATYVGQRAGGTKKGSFAGQWHTGKLPNTKIQYRIPYFKIGHYLPNTHDSSLFIEPEIELNYEWEDFLKYEDSYLKQLKDLIISEKSTQN